MNIKYPSHRNPLNENSYMQQMVNLINLSLEQIPLQAGQKSLSNTNNTNKIVKQIWNTWQSKQTFGLIVALKKMELYQFQWKRNQCDTVLFPNRLHHSFPQTYSFNTLGQIQNPALFHMGISYFFSKHIPLSFVRISRPYLVASPSVRLLRLP